MTTKREKSMLTKNFDFRIVRTMAQARKNWCSNENCVCHRFLYGNEAMCRIGEYIDTEAKIELWSGMLDSNGTRIYEGDILDCDGFSFIVGYENTQFVVLDVVTREFVANLYAYLTIDCFSYFVVGNIHNNH